MRPWLRRAAGGCEVLVKVVPGASRSALGGELGDRIKVRVSAPPEGGKANRAVEELLAELCGLRCTVSAGHGNPLKTVLVQGGDPDVLERVLAPAG